MIMDILKVTLKDQHDSFVLKELGIEREILRTLEPLVLAPQVVVITGLRRVGKSTLLAQIAKKYFKDNYYFVNFEDERLINFEVQDFDLLHQTLISLYGEKKTFIFDEIQNVVGWERFVRRLHDLGYKFIITGSNASLLSQELATKLTGRSLKVEVFPFSFREYLLFKKFEIPDLNILNTKEKGKLLKITNEYISLGGIPDGLRYPGLQIHKTLYDDVLYRDIATRYNLDNVKSLKELSFYLSSNISSLISFNKLKELLKLGSTNTVKSYIDYLENSWLFFTVNKYAFSVKEQQIAAKKTYCVDTGLAQSVGFSFSKNWGKLMENVVFLQLKRKHSDIFYYKTKSDFEVDFYVPKENILIQVSQHFDSVDTKDREIRAIVSASVEIKNKPTMTIVTESEKENIKIDGQKISLVPMYEWLLKD